MSNTTTTQSRKAVTVDAIKPNDIIYISNEGTTQYLVLDVGNPFILIEDLDTHFCHLYRPTILYID